MALDGKAPLKETVAWQALQKYFDENKNQISVAELFRQDPARFSRYSASLETPLDGPFLVDYSKNRVDDAALALLFSLARERGVEQATSAMFAGERINFTEDRAVLHTALRNRSNTPVMVSVQLWCGVGKSIHCNLTISSGLCRLVGHHQGSR